MSERVLFFFFKVQGTGRSRGRSLRSDRRRLQQGRVPSRDVPRIGDRGRDDPVGWWKDALERSYLRLQRRDLGGCGLVRPAREIIARGRCDCDLNSG